MDVYERVVGELLEYVSLNSGHLAAVVGLNVASSTVSSRAELELIERERQRAMDRYLKDRDLAALDAAMAELDRRAVASQEPMETQPVPAETAVEFLRELPKTWGKAKGGKGRQLLASALFDRVEVLGTQEMAIDLSAHALRYGMGEVLPAELRLPVYGRGERSQTDPGDLNVPLPLSCEVLGRRRWTRAAAG